MKRTRLCAALTAGIVVSAICGVAHAGELPAPQYMSYLILQTPGDPNSVATFAVTLQLEATESSGSGVGWTVLSVKIRRYGESTTVWTEESPNVNTPDGLWWVQHADPLNAQPEEFDDTPLLSGTATAADANGPDLQYSFDAQVYRGRPPYTPLTSATYSFTLVGEEEPPDDGDDVPEPIIPEQDPPSSSWNA